MTLSRWAMGITIGSTIISMTGTALASTGCDAVNAGVFNRTNYTPPGSGVLNTQAGFDVGDTINFTVSGLPGSSFELINGALNTALVSQPLSNIPASLSYTVTGSNGDTTLNTKAFVISRINSLMLNQPSGISLRDRGSSNSVGIVSN